MLRSEGKAYLQALPSPKEEGEVKRLKQPA